MQNSAETQLRTRVVTFRLTEQEYEWLKTQCDGSASSISAAARNAVLAAPPVSSCSLSESRFEFLGHKLDHILRLLTSSTLPPVSEDQSEAIPDAHR
jgi:hypothetical protein